MSNTLIGKFITFEGAEGSGKTTQSKILYEKLLNNGIKAVWTREIGGTDASEAIRDIVLFRDMSIITELLLVMAARYEHIEKFIKPHLSAGKWVICDRFIDSTLCYQAKNNDERQLILELHRKLLNDFFPDLTFIINVAPSITIQRIKMREMQKRTEKINKFDSKDQLFHQKIANAFIQISKLFPERIVQINGESTIEEISSEIIHIINNRMKVSLLR